MNLASRIEGLTGKLDKRALVSDALARHLPSLTRPVGAFELEGIAEPQLVHELVRGHAG